MEKTTRLKLQECTSTPLACTASSEPLNDTKYSKKVISSDTSKFQSHVRSGYNPSNRGSLSAKHLVYVVGIDGKPLTPTTPKRAKKLMKEKQARPLWNKFGQFGIHMEVSTRTEKPKSVLGIDNGTKFEGYTVTVGKENIIGIMWKLPDKKKLVKKLVERKQLRRARRFRNCRRRKCKFQNRKETFIAPSQKQIIDSRLKCIKELYNYYPIDGVAIEDVCFNHKKYRWGKNFTTIEIGKKIIDDFFINKNIKIYKFKGHQTESFRKKYGYQKLKCNKSKIDFRTHCADALSITAETMGIGYIEPTENFIYVDDSYRCTRRRLHDTQYSKGNIRYPYSSGSFKGISKGCIIGFDGGYGQLVGGTKNNCWYRDFELRNKKPILQKGKIIKKIRWISHGFKYIGG